MKVQQHKHRRSAQEVTAIIACLRAALARLPQSEDEPALPPVGRYACVELYTRSGLRRTAERTDDLTHEASTVLERCVRQLRARGRFRRLILAPSPVALDPLRVRFPHFCAVIDYLVQQLALANLEPGTPLHLPPILLDGDPGVGKTHFCNCVAKALGVPFHEIDLGSGTAGFAIGGLDLGWSTGQPGKIFQVLVNDYYANSIVLLDEIDKANQHDKFDVLGPLYGLLEPGTAVRFEDEAVRMPMDASHILWFATCNNLATIPQPIVSRLTVFTVPLPARDEGRQIAQGIYDDLRTRHGWGRRFAPALAPEVLDALATVAPREMLQILRRAAGRAAIAHRYAIEPCDLVTPQRRSLGFV
jgi:ATP-dependent Lon protease